MRSRSSSSVEIMEKAFVNITFTELRCKCSVDSSELFDYQWAFTEVSSINYAVIQIKPCFALGSSFRELLKQSSPFDSFLLGG